MNTLIELPYEIIELILTDKSSDITVIGKLSCVCRHFNSYISPGIDTLIKKYLATKFPYLVKLIKIDNIKYSDISLDKLEKLLDALHKVSVMKKNVKYQHLLVGCYNASLFRMEQNEFKLKPSLGIELYRLEQRTLSLLTSLFNYVKLILPSTKTQLEFWALYPLFEYSILSMEDSYRKDESIFQDGNLMKDKAKEIRRRIQFVNVSKDIKYRMMKLLNYIDPELSSDDDQDY